MGQPAGNATYLKNALDSFMSEEFIFSDSFFFQGYLVVCD